jgi:putative RecB family exonuclease
MSIDLLSHASPVTDRGGVWAYLSPSRLNCWLSCGLKFKLTYIEGMRLPTTPALFLGKVCHASLECYYRHRQLGVTLDAAEVSRRTLESWAQTVDEEGATFESTADEQALQRQAAELVATYLKHVPSDEPRPLAVEVAAEAPLVDPATGEDLGIPLLGIMDLVLDGPTGPVITDFKTTSRSSEPLEITHEIQLSSYAWLFRHVHGRMEAGLEIRSLIKTKTPKVEIHAYPARTDAHFRRLFAVIRAYLDDLDSGRFVFRPGFGCGMCDFAKTHCPRWRG